MSRKPQKPGALCPYHGEPCRCAGVCALDAIRDAHEADALATPQRERGAA